MVLAVEPVTGAHTRNHQSELATLFSAVSEEQLFPGTGTLHCVATLRALPSWAAGRIHVLGTCSVGLVKTQVAAAENEPPAAYWPADLPDATSTFLSGEVHWVLRTSAGVEVPLRSEKVVQLWLERIARVAESIGRNVVQLAHTEYQ